ncbi:hypothetical protein V9K67_14755 [Paraflavisolibacter sp. H34]|uniref:hypothetical protein n=1 Tax=Huijunlia imazamoxiresistens TaxID=3127457 RepID=UPI003015E847
MKTTSQGPRLPQDSDPKRNPSPADNAPKREGGDDSLAQARPDDYRADEKVIVNEQRESKTVNAPSQTAVNTNTSISNDEEAL